MHSFPDLNPVCCSMSSSNCSFLTCVQISQEAGKVVWYSHLFKNFPQFVVIHTVERFGVVNKAEVDVFFWNSLAFLMIQWMLAIWSLVPLPFLNPAWTSGTVNTVHSSWWLAIEPSQPLLPLLLLPSIFSKIRVFSNELALHIRWANYWSFSFSISPSSEYSGLISFSTD